MRGTGSRAKMISFLARPPKLEGYGGLYLVPRAS